jgi:hypothetical protein
LSMDIFDVDIVGVSSRLRTPAGKHADATEDVENIGLG